MPKPESPAPATASSSVKTFTNWKAFEEAGLVPITLDCQAYKPVHLHDTSCHTHLLINPDTLKQHIAAEHGGAFQIYLRKTDGKPAKFWADLTASGLEAQDLRCEVCGEGMRFHPTSFAQHLKPHRGKTRHSYREVVAKQPKAIGLFSLTLGSQQPQNLEEVDEYES